MPPAFVLDEQLRGPLWRAIQQHNAGGRNGIDIIRVGDRPGLPLGSTDPEILLWAEGPGRVLVTRDVSTIPGHLADHLQAGHHAPGILAIRRRSKLPDVVFALALFAYAGDATDVEDRIVFIP